MKSNASSPRLAACGGSNNNSCGGKLDSSTSEDDLSEFGLSKLVIDLDANSKSPVKSPPLPNPIPNGPIEATVPSPPDLLQMDNNLNSETEKFPKSVSIGGENSDDSSSQQSLKMKIKRKKMTTRNSGPRHEVQLANPGAKEGPELAQNGLKCKSESTPNLILNGLTKKASGNDRGNHCSPVPEKRIKLDVQSSSPIQKSKSASKISGEVRNFLLFILLF